MGLKYGMAALAAERGLYVPLTINDGKPFPLARVIIVKKEAGSRVEYALRYPNGVIGRLALTEELQLEPYFFEFASSDASPTEDDLLAMAGKLPSSRIIFEGAHQVRGDIPGHELEIEHSLDRDLV